MRRVHALSRLLRRPGGGVADANEQIVRVRAACVRHLEREPEQPLCEQLLATHCVRTTRAQVRACRDSEREVHRAGGTSTFRCRMSTTTR